MPVYVVTGARAGIGLEYIRRLGSHQTNTVFAVVRSLTGDLTALRGIQAAGPGTIHIVDCDVSSETSIAALPGRIQSASKDANLRIDYLINNAAILHSRDETALTLSSAALLDHITANVLGPAKVLQALRPLLAPGGAAKVVNITSGIASMAMVGDGRISAAITPYSISKAALNMLTVHQARQLRDEGITVVAVDPGHCKTEMGGPDAVVEPADSARGTLKVLEGLKPEDSGKFLLYTGAELEW